MTKEKSLLEAYLTYADQEIDKTKNLFDKIQDDVWTIDYKNTGIDVETILRLNGGFDSLRKSFDKMKEIIERARLKEGLV